MARFGQVEEVVDEVSSIDMYWFDRFAVGLVLFFCLGMIGVSIFGISDLSNNKKGEINMEILGSIEMVNKHALCREVKYGELNRHDPKDTSNIYCEVVKGDDGERFVAGDLVKFNYRFLEKVQIDGEMYLVLNPDIVQYVIRKRNVQEGLLKR